MTATHGPSADIRELTPGELELVSGGFPDIPGLVNNVVGAVLFGVAALEHMVGAPPRRHHEGVEY
jgi:hypothetical protein